MKNLSRREGIAVAVGLAVLAYLLFAGSITRFFMAGDEQVDLVARSAEEGFVAQEVSVGSGPLAEPGDLITVHYVGRLLDGKVFDSSVDSGVPFSFTLGAGEVIRGWDYGVQGMRAGGRRVLIISPDFAYGPRAIGAIPANSTLIFEVELLEVEKRSTDGN